MREVANRAYARTSVLKSIAVVVGSYALSIALVLACSPLLSWLFPADFAKGNIPATTSLITSTALFFAISIFCAFVCARGSPAPASRHVFWFFVLGEMLGVATAVANWSNGWPHWYALSWIIIWPLACWLGYLLGGRKKVAG